MNLTRGQIEQNIADLNAEIQKRLQQGQETIDIINGRIARSQAELQQFAETQKSDVQKLQGRREAFEFLLSEEGKQGEKDTPSADLPTEGQKAFVGMPTPESPNKDASQFYTDSKVHESQPDEHREGTEPVGVVSAGYQHPTPDFITNDNGRVTRTELPINGEEHGEV